MSADVRALLRAAAVRLGGDEGRREGELLLAHALRRSRAWLFAHPESEPDASQVRAFDELLGRRQAGEPVAYLTGRRAFWTFELEVTPAVLIPRPETERLVELALEHLPPAADVQVADLGTGSGAIALALAQERPRARVLATDASAAALAVAQANARRLGLVNVLFAQGDWCDALGGTRFDLVVSNPPYIAEADPHLAAGDLRHEPVAALASGADGLVAIRSIVDAARAHLRHGGQLLFEHGFDQGAAARDLLATAGYADIATARDLEGRERVSGGRWPGS